MQTVSFETAKKLKEAGFPQPAQCMGQWWYNPKGYRTLTAFDDSYADMAKLVMDEYVYAPTATELLPEDWLLMREGPNWICQHFEDSHKYVIDDNPAETAALAWLYVNKK